MVTYHHELEVIESIRLEMLYFFRNGYKCMTNIKLKYKN